MSRYTCWTCKNEHDTDNMVAHCASCYIAIKSRIKELEGPCGPCRQAEKKVKALEAREAALREAMQSIANLLYMPLAGGEYVARVQRIAKAALSAPPPTVKE